MSRIPITVCIIAKNEEKHIENCLKHLMPYGFEIVVADTGSTDRTKLIAQKYADKVVDFEWVDDFSAARNYCASFATNNWILSIDCDEYVESIDIGIMRILMQKMPKAAGILRLKNLIISNGEQGYGSDDVTRLYNKNYYEFQGEVHEQVTSKNATSKNETMQCFLIPADVIHHGYALSQEEMLVKQRRNLELLYKQLEKDDTDPYIYFQIGQSEFILDHHDKAIEFYEKGLSFNASCDFLYVQVMIMSLAKAYVHSGQVEKAVKLMDSYASSCKTAKFTFTYASVLLDNKQYLKALMMYIKTTSMPDIDTLGENEMHCYNHIINLYKMFGDEKMAQVFVDRYNASVRERERVLSS